MSARGTAAWLFPLAVGLVLRLWNLPAQILGGDELHVVRAALELGFPEVLTTYRSTDHGIPLAALHRLALESGVVPATEMLFRAPALVSSGALLVALPWLVARRFSSEAGLAAAWLVAVSPLLVLYGRIARSYAPVSLLAPLAVVAFVDWWERGDARRGAAYVALATIAIWLHLLAAPFVLAPFAAASTEWIAARRTRRDAVRLLALGCALLATLALSFVPAMPTLLSFVSDKVRGGSLSGATLVGASRLLGGTTDAATLIVLAAFAIVGVVVGQRQCPRLVSYAVAASAAQLVLVVLVRPTAVSLPPQLARYLIFALPVVLALVAIGMAAAARMGARAGVPPSSSIALAGLLVFAMGPFPDPAYRDSQFVHHKDLLGFHSPPADVDPEHVPDFYRSVLRSNPGKIVEAPWAPAWKRARAIYAYPLVHGQRTVVVPTDERLHDGRLRFRNMTPPEPRAVEDTGARYLVLHKDIAAEERRVGGDRRSPESAVELDRVNRELYAEPITRWRRRFEREWGPPDHDDDDVWAWDLERARGKRRAERSAGAPSAQAP